MGKQLSKEELQVAIDAIEFAQTKTTPPPAMVRLCQSAVAKLRQGLEAAQQHEQQKGTIEPERFPQVLTAEEAQQYDALGQELMMHAAKGPRLSEQTHHKLTCLLVGLTSSLVRVLQVPRQLFCTNLATNVMFAALKAAYAIPLASRTEPADGPKEE